MRDTRSVARSRARTTSVPDRVVTLAWARVSREDAEPVVDRLLYSRHPSSPGVGRTLERAERHLADGRRDLAARGTRRAAALLAAVRQLGWTEQGHLVRVLALAQALGMTLSRE